MCEATPFCYKSVTKHIKSSVYTAYLTHLGKGIHFISADAVVDSLNTCATSVSTAICNQLESLRGICGRK